MTTLVPDMRFGRWTVLESLPPRNSRPQVRCRCDCGRERVVLCHSLLKGSSTSCGCRQKLAWTPGQQFGRFTVVGPASWVRNTTYVQCRCVCGTERTVSLRHLYRGRSTSCGCWQREDLGA